MPRGPRWPRRRRSAWPRSRHNHSRPAYTAALLINIVALVPPHASCSRPSNRGVGITVQVVAGRDVTDRLAPLYVEKRELYEIVRVEHWPPLAHGSPPRVLITLKAWPSA
jgi:hypothetical protein